MQDRSHTGHRPIARLSWAALVCVLLGLSLTACGSNGSGPEPPPDPRLAFQPKPGPYRYTTKGFERIDALLGARHGYPATTQVRVASRPCGYSERWNALSERWTRFDYCVAADGSRTLKAVADYHEFFGYPVALNYRCEGTAIPPLTRSRRGDRWTNRCEGGSTDLRLRWKVIGQEPIDVKGKPIETVHFRIEATTTGKAAGASTNDSWLAESNGLLVRRAVSGKARTRTPVGTVRSNERYSMRLQATAPQATRAGR